MTKQMSIYTVLEYITTTIASTLSEQRRESKELKAQLSLNYSIINVDI
jgi:hypothetical protein